MPKLAHRLPAYRLHKASGQARVRVEGRSVYLGPFGSPESKAAYDRFCAEWLARGRRLRDAPPPPPSGPAPQAGLTLVDLMVRYKDHCRSYYVGPDGEPTREVANIGLALRPARKLFGALPAAEFGPASLRAVREEMVRSGLSRTTVNGRVNRVRRFFRWAVGHDLVPPEVLARLEAVDPLRRGREGVREAAPVRAVSRADVEATLPHLPPMVRAMVEFAWHTGARPGEVTALTTATVDRSGEVWVARPGHHKTAHHGLDRSIFIGPRAREALAPWLRPEEPEAPVFSPLRVDVRQPHRHGRRRPGRSPRPRCGPWTPCCRGASG